MKDEEREREDGKQKEEDLKRETGRDKENGR